MRINPQDLEEAQQDYFLEMLQSTNSVPSKTDPRRVENIRKQNQLRGRRTGSWVTGTLKYMRVYSLDVMEELQQLPAPDMHHILEMNINMDQVLNLCNTRERRLLNLYLKHDGSPGQMSIELDCTPQYTNRVINATIESLSERVARPWANNASMPYQYIRTCSVSTREMKETRL